MRCVRGGTARNGTPAAVPVSGAGVADSGTSSVGRSTACWTLYSARVSASRRPGQRAGLTRDAVLAAARELLTAGGLEALSMRALASRLGVAPNALYSHVPSKTALLDDLLDDLLGAVRSPDRDTADPAAGLAVLMQSTYDVLTAHPDLVPLFLSRQGARGANAARLGQTMDALLERAGLTGPAGTQARRVLIVHTIGSAAFATSPAQDDDRPLSAQQALSTFNHGLHWLLDGITAVPGRTQPSAGLTKRVDIREAIAQGDGTDPPGRRHLTT